MNIIHKDLEPFNIILLNDGFIKTWDFKIAKLLSSKNFNDGIGVTNWDFNFDKIFLTSKFRTFIDGIGDAKNSKISKKELHQSVIKVATEIFDNSRYDQKLTIPLLEYWCSWSKMLLLQKFFLSKSSTIENLSINF